MQKTANFQLQKTANFQKTAISAPNISSKIDIVQIPELKLQNTTTGCHKTQIYAFPNDIHAANTIFPNRRLKKGDDFFIYIGNSYLLKNTG